MSLLSSRPAPTPDDLMDSDPPPAFPPWMVANDPRLAAQDTNRLYVAFRRRRTWYRRAGGFGRGWLGGAAHLRGGLSGAGTVGIGTLSFFLLVCGLGPLGCLAWLALMGILALAHQMRRRDVRLFDDAAKAQRLPDWLTVGFPASGSDPMLAALEVCWSVGANGREVAEALYLELREQELKAARLVAAALSLPAWVFFFVGWWWSIDLLRYWINTVPALLWLGSCALLAWRGVLLTRPESALRNRLRGWQRYYPGCRGVSGSIGLWLDKDLPYVLPRLIVGGFIALVWIVVAVMFIARASDLSALGEWRHLLQTPLVASVSIVLLVVPLMVIMLIIREDNEQQIAKHLEGAIEEAFAVMAGVCASGDDPDEMRAILVQRGQLALNDYWSRPTTTTLQLQPPRG